MAQKIEAHCWRELNDAPYCRGNPVRGRTAALSWYGSFIVIVITFINSINREFCPLRGRGESRAVLLRRWQAPAASEAKLRGRASCVRSTFCGIQFAQHPWLVH